MNLLLLYKRHFSTAFLLFFLCSTNALCYGGHMVKDIRHDHTATAHLSCHNVSSDSNSTGVVNHHQDNGQGMHHEEGESCCHSHSHASIFYDPLCIKHITYIISRPIIEPFKFIPEVYPDKFIPPQNLA